MEFRILGALEVRDDGDRRIPLGAGKQRAALAILLLHANEIVATDRLIDELWGGSPPETARKALQVYVTRLRKALGPERIQTREPGYMLELAPEELDLERFQRLVGHARELRDGGDRAREAVTLRDALALWTGPPLADLAYEPFAQAEIPRLEDLRLEALADRIDAELAVGRGADLVGELEALVAQHPYRERPRGQLMLVLYRDGRQADALAVYQETRTLLVEELGIEPSPALRRLEGAILRQAPALETGLEEPAPTEPSSAVALPRRRKWPLVATVIGLLLVATLVAIGLTRSSGPDSLSRLEENTVGVIDADAARIEAQVSLGNEPSGIGAGGGFVWVVSESDGTLSRIDPRTHAVRSLSLEGSAAGVAYGGGSVWVANPERRSIEQIDPETLTPVQRIEVGNGPGPLAVGEGAVWVVNTLDGTVSRIDLTRGVVTQTIRVGPGPAGIAVGENGVWVTSETIGAVTRIDPRSGRAVLTVNVGNAPTGVVATPGGVWVANRQDGTVSRIDPVTNVVSPTLDVGRNPTAVAAGMGAIWVADGGSATVTRIDSDERLVDATISTESSPSGLAVADGKVWASALASPGSHRGGVLRVESEPSACRCSDPAFLPEIVNLTDMNVMTLAYDGLVAYRRVGGIAGARLVANLARRVPTPVDNGRTYTFELRRNTTYSNGAPVQASDVRYSLERLLTLNLEGGARYAQIVGATKCTGRRGERCDLSEGIEVDDDAGTVTIHLTEPDPAFLYGLAWPLASVVPSGTPLRKAGEEPIPGTGPYRVASFRPEREVQLVRNSHFRVRSQDGRPDGYPDEIRFHLADRFEAQLRAVERGQADWLNFTNHLGNLGVEGRKRLLTKHGTRLRSDPAPFTLFWFLNTRVPPFDDVRVRRALSYATDRGGLVELGGGPAFAPPTCQILPPSFPAFRPYCPYTLDTNPAGTWTAPDLARARALVAASGTRGMRVEVVTFELQNPFPEASARYFASLLRRLGYRSSVNVLPGPAEHFQYVADSRNRAQMGQHGWVAEAPAPSNFLERLFSCASFVPGNAAENLNPSEFCDPEIDAAMRRAETLQMSDPAGSNTLWAEVDRALVDRAAALPVANPRDVGLVSERVDNYQYHVILGTLLDQLWVK
jgi:ABC-type transport system substrate-binding protein/DNA-binding SARP family transcriptional activator